MSYYFCIIGTKDNPLFEHEFGTSKQGGDGIARFPAEARHINQFIVHSSLDIVEEVQWLNNQMYGIFHLIALRICVCAVSFFPPNTTFTRAFHSRQCPLTFPYSKPLSKSMVERQ